MSKTRDKKCSQQGEEPVYIEALCQEVAHRVTETIHGMPQGVLTQTTRGSIAATKRYGNRCCTTEL